MSEEQDFLRLRRQYLDKRFSHLNDMQREAVFTTKGPLLILAGAGSGKTTVLVNRIANLILFGNAYNSQKIFREPTAQDIEDLAACIEQQAAPPSTLMPLLCVEPVNPWNILAITFTNKAAQELKIRLRSLLGDEVGSDVNASTFHSMCVRILRREAERLGFAKSFTIYDSDDQQRVIKAIYKEQNIDDKFLAVKAAASAMGRLKDKMISPREAEESAAEPRAKMIANIYKEYSKRCKKADAMDFDDLIYYTVRLLSEFADVREYYQNRFKYIMVDEYQDTSVAQFRLISLLCSPLCNIAVVGDDDQSIYRFRGATIENILNFESTFAGAKAIRLEQNYRSTSNILNAANAVIKNNAGRKGKTLWTDNGDGCKVIHYTAENEQDEAVHIATEIGQNLNSGAKLRDHVVLYRMNAQSSPVENYFARSGIPYKIIGGLRFNDRKEVKDIHAYMSIIVNPSDDLRLRRIINEPARKIGPTTVDKIAEIAAGLGVPMLEVIREADSYPALSKAGKALSNFYGIYSKLLEAAEEMSIEKFAEEIPEITGYKAMLEAAGEEGITRLENIGQIVSNVKTYADQHGLEGSIEAYLEEIALISDIDSYDEDADTVIMMTLHSAKGLEFPYVYIVGMEEGIFPSDMARFSEEDIEEERRLCYVGITRAKKKLTLLSAQSRLLYGQTRRNKSSRFVEEIDKECVEEQVSSRIMSYRQKAFIQSGSSGFGGGFGQTGSAGQAGANFSPFGGASQQSAAWSYAAPAKKPSENKAKTQNTVSYAVNDKVEHKVFGHGVVQKVTPLGGDTLVEVIFDSAGLKKTMANYAPMKKL